ncbi:ankyrin repeat domain-containing protein [Wenyingzhuangia sp. IMCC45467]
MKFSLLKKHKNDKITLEKLTEIIQRSNLDKLLKEKNKGIDFTITDSYDGENILEYLIKNEIDPKIEKSKLFEFLINCGVDINHKTNKRADQYSALHYSVLRMDIKSIEILIKLNAEIEIQDKYGNTPLIRAVMNYRGEDKLKRIIELLIDKGASIEKKNFHDISAKDHINNIGGGIDAGYNNSILDLRSII